MTVLIDAEYNCVSSVPIDYYTIGSSITWVGYIYNNTDTNIADCKVATDGSCVGIISISGGGVTGYNPVTSDWDTTCSLGLILSGEMKPIIIQTCISGGPVGLRTVPLYISK